MKKKLIFIIPILALLGFLAIKPPAVGTEKKQIVVTPTSTSTPISKPNLRDFGDDGRGPDHMDHHGFPGDDHHDGLHDDGDLHEGENH